jgi:enoyl-CoA hydratase
LSVDVERDGAVGVITLNRPNHRNAFNNELTQSLSRALDELDDDPEIRVGILAASGPVFCAGTDMHEKASPSPDRGGEYGLIRRRRTTPLIAAVDGPAYGGGCELVLACDLVVASSRARFGLPEVSRGLVATCGGLFRTQDRIPPVIAAEMVLTGDPLAAERAYQLGLVNVFVGSGSPLEGARILATRITKNSPDAVTASLRALHAARQSDEGIGWTATGQAIAEMAVSPDRGEGVEAFFAKREPRWIR